MLSSTQKRTHQIPLTHGLRSSGVAAIAFGTAFTLDHLIGAHESQTRRTNPEFYTDSQPGRQHTLGILPGCQIDGKALFGRLLLHTPETNLIVTDYPKRGFDVEAICEGLAKQLLKVRAERPSLLCQSMGGMVVRHFMEYADRTGLAEKVGGFDTIILDSSPFDDSDIHRRYTTLLGAAAAGQNSWAANHIKPLIMQHGHGWSAHTPLSAVVSQGNFMHAEHPNEQIPDIAGRIVYVHGPSADPVIDTEQAIHKYEQLFGNRFEAVVDMNRPPHSHTAGTPQIDFLLSHANIGIDYHNLAA